jgi:hypothetical protein
MVTVSGGLTLKPATTVYAGLGSKLISCCLGDYMLMVIIVL